MKRNDINLYPWVQYCPCCWKIHRQWSLHRYIKNKIIGKKNQLLRFFWVSGYQFSCYLKSKLNTAPIIFLLGGNKKISTKIGRTVFYEGRSDLFCVCWFPSLPTQISHFHDCLDIFSPFWKLKTQFPQWGTENSCLVSFPCTVKVLGISQQGQRQSREPEMQQRRSSSAAQRLGSCREGI